jgi:hypothetical protein
MTPRALAASNCTNGGAAAEVGPDPHGTCPTGDEAAGFGTARHSFGRKSNSREKDRWGRRRLGAE